MEVCRLCIPFMVRLIFLALSLIPSNDLRAGGKDLEEVELLHLDGHKGSRPVRIGNGAADEWLILAFMIISVVDKTNLNPKIERESDSLFLIGQKTSFPFKLKLATSLPARRQENI
jgi:hypothetical protein